MASGAEQILLFPFSRTVIIFRASECPTRAASEGGTDKTKDCKVNPAAQYHLITPASVCLWDTSENQASLPFILLFYSRK